MSAGGQGVGRLPELLRGESSQPREGCGACAHLVCVPSGGGWSEQTGKRSSIRPKSTAEGGEEHRLEEQMLSLGHWEPRGFCGARLSGLLVIICHGCPLHGELSEKPRIRWDLDSLMAERA